jgi:hypothetical protein
MKSKKYHYKRWFFQAPIGLIIIGFGACLIAESAISKANNQPWFLFGAVALCVFNSGICIFGDAILHRVRYENSTFDKK